MKLINREMREEALITLTASNRVDGVRVLLKNLTFLIILLPFLLRAEVSLNCACEKACRVETFFIANAQVIDGFRSVPVDRGVPLEFWTGDNEVAIVTHRTIERYFEDRKEFLSKKFDSNECLIQALRSKSSGVRWLSFLLLKERDARKDANYFGYSPIVGIEDSKSNLKAFEDLQRLFTAKKKRE